MNINPAINNRMKSSNNNPAIYADGIDRSALYEALELADAVVTTEVENYHFIYRAAAWALDNATEEQIRRFDPRNDDTVA